MPSVRRIEPLAQRGVDRTDRCTDIDQRTQSVDEQGNQHDQKANVAAIQVSTLPAGDAAAPPAGGYEGRDDAEDALRVNSQVHELEPRALRLIPLRLGDGVRRVRI